MGSRLKGKRPPRGSDRQRRVVIRLIVYAAVGIGVIALLWGLWLSEKGLKKAEDMRGRPPAGPT